MNDPCAKLVERVLGELDTLSPREREILKKRFGIGGPSRTTEELGREFGVTGVRVRQIEARALRKLMFPSGSRILGTRYFRPSRGTLFGTVTGRRRSSRNPTFAKLKSS